MLKKLSLIVEYHPTTGKPLRERQVLVLSAYCESHNWNCEVIKDLGSGLNYKEKGLRKLIDTILNNECDTAKPLPMASHRYIT